MPQNVQFIILDSYHPSILCFLQEETLAKAISLISTLSINTVLTIVILNKRNSNEEHAVVFGNANIHVRREDEPNLAGVSQSTSLTTVTN
jgi:hypothetical protein